MGQLDVTPLAQRIVKRLALQPSKREPIVGDDVSARMGGVHCFDVTDALDMLDDLAVKLSRDSMDRKGVDSTLAFLPAPRTWIEYREEGSRKGYLLLSGPTVLSASAELYAVSDDEGALHAWHGGRLALMSDDPDWLPVWSYDELHLADHIRAQFLIYAALAVINSPLVIGRRQNAPHRGLERSLLKAGVGTFPLHAWTEIQLAVHKPTESDGKEEDGHLTGRKALHFCRAHLRIRMGRIEHVSGHWRGDAALGIKRSRYKVRP